MVELLTRTDPAPPPTRIRAHTPPHPPRRVRADWAAPLLAFAAFIAVWKLVVVVGNVGAYLLPSPEAVVQSGWDALRDGILWPHLRATLTEAAGGALLGIAVALVLGYAVVHWSWLDRAIAPFIAASQALPVVAIAPIIIVWFGTGLQPKVIICALIVFFPVLVTWAVGLRGIDPDLRGVARLFGANPWQTLRYVEIPLALPSLLGGVRIAFTLAVTGAVVGEFVSAKVGLGYLLKQAEFLYDTPLKFAALFCLMAVAALGYAVVSLLERWLLDWRN